MSVFKDECCNLCPLSSKRALLKDEYTLLYSSSLEMSIFKDECCNLCPSSLKQGIFKDKFYYLYSSSIKTTNLKGDGHALGKHFIQNVDIHL